MKKDSKMKHNYRCPSCGYTIGTDCEVRGHCNPCKVNLVEIDTTINFNRSGKLLKALKYLKGRQSYQEEK